MSRTFVIGDVHGCADELDELLARLPLESRCKLVFLGDLIDRGPKSRQVVERVFELSKKHEVVALRGNHEAMLLEFIENTSPRKVARFIYNGGGSTLASYADDEGTYAIPGDHVAFFRAMPLVHETEKYFFVHAGVPEIPLSKLDPQKHAEELVWMRKTQSTFKWEKSIVHGHTRVPHVEISPTRINLDTGCVYGGSLSAMELPTHRVWSVPRKRDGEQILLHDTTRRATVRFRGAIPVRIEGISAELETMDYSEIGMGIRARGPAEVKLDVGHHVRGTVGPPDLFQIDFEGTVVRRFDAGGVPHWGLSITTHQG
jgi:serine/threonine protein phosphatase 1